jgi:hypothetical protein
VRIRADRRPAHTVTRQRPSYSAKAEYPVRRSFSFPLLTSQNTGSPAFAGDDGCECGAFIFNGCYRFNFQTARKPIAVIPGRCEASNPESRDSPMRNCASEVWSFGPSRNDGESTYDFESTNDFMLATRSARGFDDSSAQGGRGERRVPVAPAASCALGSGRTHTSIRVHRNHPAFPHAMVLTAYVALSPVTGLFCHRHQRIKFCLSPVGPTQLRELDASVGASGPHDFAVRISIVRLLAQVPLTGF